MEFRDVTFGYDEHTVLKHLSFQVEEGEQITLSGRTGAGKVRYLSCFWDFTNRVRAVCGLTAERQQRLTGRTDVFVWLCRAVISQSSGNGQRPDYAV